jgi:uncharacterized protein YutE (UPF0331/DUF86 family)
MEKERINRYKDKFDFSIKRLDQAEEWLSDEDEKSKLACYKAFQEAIKALTDIFAMFLSDNNKTVKKCKSFHFSPKNY